MFTEQVSQAQSLQLLLYNVVNYKRFMAEIQQYDQNVLEMLVKKLHELNEMWRQAKGKLDYCFNPNFVITKITV